MPWSYQQLPQTLTCSAFLLWVWVFFLALFPPSCGREGWLIDLRREVHAYRRLSWGGYCSLWKLDSVAWAAPQGCRAGEVGRDHWAHPRLSHLQPGQIALSWGCWLGFEYFQNWKLHNFPGQAVPVFGHEAKKDVFLCLNRISKHCYLCPFFCCCCCFCISLEGFRQS